MSVLSTRKAKGFTLIEVLVAVAVIAFTVPAIMSLMVNQSNYAGSIRDQTFAYWVAENHMAMLRHNHTHHQQLPNRENSEVYEMAGAEWTVITDIEQTEGGQTVKYTMTVSREPDKPLAVLETFLDVI